MSRLRTIATFVTVRWGRRFASRPALERFQARRVRRHLRFLRRRSAWFRQAPSDLAALPTMDKRIMMEHFDDLNTVGVRKEDVAALALDAERRRDFSETLRGVSVGLSSGTSGHRGLFITSRAERDRWAGSVLALTLPRGRLLGHRIALFLRADNELYETVRSRAVDFRFFDLYGDLDAHVAALAEYEPTILVAPPSVLDALLAAGSRVRPRRVYSVAEVLTDADAERLARGFGQSVLHQLYQCTEGFLAHTCHDGVLHLNEQFAMIEREHIDERRFVPLVTDFSRTSQPIVRYRLNDILVLRETPCACGSVLTALERIEGREDDVLILGGERVFADLVTRALVSVDGFEQYRVTQTGRSAVRVELDRLDAESAVRASLEALWDRVGVPAPELEFTRFAVDRARKLRRVVRAWRGETDKER